MQATFDELREAHCCHRCLEDFRNQRRNQGANRNELTFMRCMMILCPNCGNKRCPKASDHRMLCSGSNAPGQAGSVYE